MPIFFVLNSHHHSSLEKFPTSKKIMTENRVAKFFFNYDEPTGLTVVGRGTAVGFTSVPVSYFMLRGA